MPQTNVLALEKVQAAIESTRGTDLPATRKVYAVAVGSLNRPVLEPANSTGTFADDGSIAYGRGEVGFTMDADLSYEDIPWWMKLALKGGVTGVTDGGSPPGFTYTFVPTLTADDLNSITMEFGESGLSYAAHQVMVDEWQIAINPDDNPNWRFSANCLGRDWLIEAYTGAISDRAVENISAAGTKLYIDSATIGTTQVTGKFISATITGRNQIHYKGFGEDELWVAANKVGRGKMLFDAEITFEWDADGEFLNYRAANPGVRRFVRIEREGSIIHTTVKKRVRIDMHGFWTTFSPGDRNGNKIYTLNLSTRLDPTSAYKLSMAIHNALTTLV
jgi:hypothetical protein